MWLVTFALHPPLGAPSLRSKVPTCAPAHHVQDQMKAARLDMVYRDFCAHLLIPLNECRRESFFLPWKCVHERHVYEKCEYKEYKRRMAMALEQHAS
jgi:NADH dehydrogenase (ubiquinone) 1 beta subcomplex subunit 7